MAGFKHGKENYVTMAKNKIEALEAELLRVKMEQLAKPQIAKAAEDYVTMLVYSKPFKDWPQGLQQSIRINVAPTVLQWYLNTLL